MLRVVHQKLLLGVLFILLGQASGWGQTTIQGTVRDTRTDKPVANTTVFFLLKTTLTNESGRFIFKTPRLEQDVVLVFEKNGYETKTIHFQLSGQNEIDIGIIPLRPQEDIDQMMSEDFVPTVTFEGGQSVGTGAESLSGLLAASPDAFISTAAYHFAAARFRLRGYDSRNTGVLLNGVPLNDPGSGMLSWYSWAGLNDVLRNRRSEVGLSPSAFAFGGIGGATSIDTRASRQRRQIKASYAVANRLYRNKAMLSLSTGTRPDGWAATIAGSRRWAQEGAIPGAFYDGWSYFLSLSKQLGKAHEFNLTAFGSPISQGLQSATTKEFYGLAESNSYNPNWGFQAGEIRNASVRRVHQPTAILRHDWKMGGQTTLTTAASYQIGRIGNTGLYWYDGRDPRPAYYRRSPGFMDNGQSDAVAEKFRSDPSVSQVNWARLYDVNRNNLATIEGANGIAGNDITGRRAQYLIEEQRRDEELLSVRTNLKSVISSRFALSGGLEWQQWQSQRFKLVDDLLDADYYLDIDKFAELAYPSNPDARHPDLNRPDRVVQKGDTFGYNYRHNLQRAAAWLQFEFTFRKIDIFLAGHGSMTEFYREGLWRNGIFPNTSAGPSEKVRFENYGGKAGLSIKFNGRNYLQMMGAYLNRAPFQEDAFISPRTRNDMASNLESETIYSAEGGYLYRGPFAKIRLTGYYTRFENQLRHNSFYFDNVRAAENVEQQGGEINYLMQGINTQHFGVEAAVDWAILPGLRITTTAAVGQYTYINRPEVTVMLDHEEDPLRSYTAFIKNFYVPNTPQTALSAGLNYTSPGYWFASFKVNYFDDIWLDFNPDRRTTEAVVYRADDDVVSEGSDLWKAIIFQEKAPAAYTLDFFGGKSFQINNVFLDLNVGVNNILDNQDFITGGYEQFRFDYENKDVNKYPNHYFYGWGRNFFVQLALRL